MVENQSDTNESNSEGDSSHQGKKEIVKILVAAAAIIFITLCIVKSSGNNILYSNIEGSSIDDSGVYYAKYEKTENSCQNEEVQSPLGWKSYEFFSAFKMSAPSTLELSPYGGKYSKSLAQTMSDLGVNYIIFQQAGLTAGKPEALAQYCRIIIEYFKGNNGDYLKSTETIPIDYETRSAIQDYVVWNLGPSSKQIGTTQYKWVAINNYKVLQVDYKRTGKNFDASISVVCKVLYYHNYNEMMRIVLSYRESEADLWADDFDRVVQTIKWI